MALAAKILKLGAVLALVCLLPGAPFAGDITGDCSQDPDSPPERGADGQVSIVTNPEKAVVYLGGIKLGPSPIDTTVPSGRHTLTIMLNGEELVNQRVNICAGQKTIVEKKLLMPYGSVTVKPNPLKANYRVSVDGEDVGYTKGGVLTINKLEAGTRVFKISQGRKQREMSVNVLAEETVEVSVDFKK